MHNERLYYLRSSFVGRLPRFYPSFTNPDSGGLLGDHVGRLNLLWPMTLLSGCLCLFIWLLSSSLATLVFFACVYGFSLSSVTALPPSIVGQITPDDKLGARIGAFYSIVAIASLVGSPIGGALITDADKKEGYQWLIIFSVSVLAISWYMV